MIKSWMIISAIAFLVFLSSGLTRSRDLQWFRRLQRPSWLTFEGAIPIIWTVIFICGVWSAVIVWESEPGTEKTWLLMGLYLLVELATMAYTPVMLRTRSLRVGTVIGATGFILSLMLIFSAWKVATWAGVLLLPYVMWSPIGTYTTWEMISLNPEDA